jgi:hypothetical protein
MLGVTLFGLFLTPVFFVTIETRFGARHTPEPESATKPAIGAQENA